MDLCLIHELYSRHWGWETLPCKSTHMTMALSNVYDCMTMTTWFSPSRQCKHSIIIVMDRLIYKSHLGFLECRTFFKILCHWQEIFIRAKKEANGDAKFLFA